MFLVSFCSLPPIMKEVQSKMLKGNNLLNWHNYSKPLHFLFFIDTLVKWMLKCLAVIFCVFYISLGLVSNKLTLEILIPSSQPTITNYLNPSQIDDKEVVKSFMNGFILFIIGFYFLSFCTTGEIFNEKRIGLRSHYAAFASVTVSYVYINMYIIV